MSQNDLAQQCLTGLNIPSSVVSESQGDIPTILASLTPSQYNKFIARLQEIGAESEDPSAMERIKSYIAELKSEREGQAEEATINWRSIYQKAKDTIRSGEKDLQRSWLEMNANKDPNFYKKRDLYLIDQKMNQLETERSEVFNKLVQDYLKNTQSAYGAYQLEARNKYLSELQQGQSKDQGNAATAIRSDLMTKRRQIQIMTYQYKSYLNKVFVLKTIFVATIIAILPILFSLMGLLTSSLATILVLVVYVIAFSILLTRLYYHWYRSRLEWEENNWPMLEKDSGGGGGGSSTPAALPECIDPETGAIHNL